MNILRFSFRHLTGPGIALLTGVALARFTAPSPPATAEGRLSAETTHLTTPFSTTRELEEAWNLLIQLPRPDGKIALEQRLLAEWIEVDFDRALAIAIHDADDGVLLALKESLISDPEKFWPAIREQRFAYRTETLAQLWFEIVGRHHPQVVLDHLPELRHESSLSAAYACLNGARGNLTVTSSIVQRIAEMPDTPENRSLWLRLGKSHFFDNHDDETSLLSGIKEAGPGLSYLSVNGIVVAMAKAKDAEGPFYPKFRDLPSGAKTEAASSILVRTQSWQIATLMIDYLVNTDRFSAFTRQRNLPWLPRKPESRQQLCAWALTLPKGEDTNTFHTFVVRPYLSENTDHAARWIDTLPGGPGKDRVLALYVNVLSSTGKIDDLKRAISQIGDGNLRRKVKALNLGTADPVQEEDEE